MLAYQFYLRDAIKGYELVGILSERRKNPIRITDKSIIIWGRKYFGRNVSVEGIFFVKVNLEKDEKGAFEAAHH